MANNQSLSESIDQLMDKTMRATRIGTCYNGFTQMLDTKNTPIDLNKLNGAQKLKLVDGDAVFNFIADSANSATENSSMWGLDTKAGGGAFGIKASAGYNMQRLHTQTTENKGMNAVISYKYVKLFFEVLKATEEELFNCMSEPFKNKFKAIMSAETATEKQRLYLEFINYYGTGCVTTLYLEAGSIANISISTDADADSSEAKYGASLAVSSKFVEASAAANWGNGYKTAGIKGTAKITSTSYPQGSPTSAWVNALVTTFAGKALDELTKSANFAALPQPQFDKAPPYPAKDAPDKDKIEKKDVDFSKEMQEKLMKEDGFEGKWEDYVAAQKAALEKCTPEDVVKEATHLSEKSGDALLFESMDTERPKMFAGLYEDLEEDMDSVGDSPWDLGGYIPIDFEITPWEQLFPSLAAPFQFTSSSVRFAKLMTFYYTRLQFGQYLNFLADAGDAYISTQKDFLLSDVDNYFNACKGYLQDMIANLPSEISEKDYQNWTSYFTNYLNNKNFQGKPVKIDGQEVPIEFHNFTIYYYFFKNYSIFSRCCFGTIYRYNYFAPDYSGRYADLASISVNGDMANGQCNKYVGTIDTLQHALRFYPVLEIADKKSEGYNAGEVVVSFVYYANKKFNRFSQHTLESVVIDGQTGHTHKRSVSFPVILISQWFWMESGHEWSWPYWDADSKTYKSEMAMLSLKPMGNPEFSMVKTSGKTMKGITPMFQDFPFNIAQSYPEGAKNKA